MSRQNHTWFWTVVHWFYMKRNWWVDLPSLALLISLHVDFYTKGIHPATDELTYFFWPILFLYWLTKEAVRWKVFEIKQRPGARYVALWMFALVEFSYVMQLLPGQFGMPKEMLPTTIYVVGGFVGLQPIKRYFAQKYPQLVKTLQSRNGDTV